MSFNPFEEKRVQAIVKKACKGKSPTAFRKLFEAVLSAESGPPSYSLGGVNTQMGAECLALAEIAAAARGLGKVELPVIADDWLNTGIEFDDDLAKTAQEAVDKVRTQSDCWNIAYEMGGWPAWTGYCRGLSTRLKKPAKKRKATPKAEGLGAVVKRLKSKSCKFEMEKREPVELHCDDEGQLDDSDLADIAQLQTLRVLNLQRQKITDKGLGQLSALKNLQSLSLSRCGLKGSGFRNLTLPKLRELSFGPTGVNLAIRNSQHLTGLREVCFRLSDITDAGLEKLAFATSLETLNISQCKKLKGTGLRALANLKNLKALKAIDLKFSKPGFRALCTLTGLKELELMTATLPVANLSELQALKRLEQLGLYRIPGLDDSHVEFLTRLRKLKTLELDRNPGISDATVKAIAKLPQLEELGLWACNITEVSTDVFLGMKKLRELSVAETGYSRAAEKRLMKAISSRK